MITLTSIHKKEKLFSRGHLLFTISKRYKEKARIVVLLVVMQQRSPLLNEHSFDVKNLSHHDEMVMCLLDKFEGAKTPFVS